MLCISYKLFSRLSILILCYCLELSISKKEFKRQLVPVLKCPVKKNLKNINALLFGDAFLNMNAYQPQV